MPQCRDKFPTSQDRLGRLGLIGVGALVFAEKKNRRNIEECDDNGEQNQYTDQELRP